MTQYILSLLIILIGQSTFAQQSYIAGYNLSDVDSAKYDAHPTGEKTLAQIAELGANHVVLNPRGVMNDPKGNRVSRRFRGAEGRDEMAGLGRLIDYIHSKGMTVGIRPIFFVVRRSSDPLFDPNRPNSYVDESGKLWWHGNIQPNDPNNWFSSFREFLASYARVGSEKNIAEFTIGAELYSMTVGLEDQWPEHPFGFPAQWVGTLNYIRDILPEARLMYDINFTDDRASDIGTVGDYGGELKKWWYRIVDYRRNAPEDPVQLQEWMDDPNQGQIWKQYVELWKNLDAIGIDMYRSLARQSDSIPEDFDSLVDLLWETSDQYANQLDGVLMDIEKTVGEPKTVIFKEVGYKAADKAAFLKPFEYEKPNDKLNVMHQAASYKAFFLGFWDAGWPWFGGVSFWDVGVNPERNRNDRPGYSPIGKEQTVEVIQSFFESNK